LRDALRYSLAAIGVEIDASAIDNLAQAYDRLALYDDAPAMRMILDTAQFSGTITWHEQTVATGLHRGQMTLRTAEAALGTRMRLRLKR
jgi:hypothetical protein